MTNASSVTTAQTLEAVNAQIAENQVDLPVAVAANQQQGTAAQVAAVKALGISVTTKASPVQTLAVENVNGSGAAAVAASTSTSAAKASATAKAKATKATSSASASAATASVTAAAKKGKNGAKRDVMRWAKRMMVGEESS
jgi:hypothetical protein